MKTLEQKIAQKEDELARLKLQSRKLENGQKIIIGGMMLAIARKDAVVAKLLLDNIDNEISKKSDLDRLADVINELKKTVAQSNEQPTQEKKHVEFAID